MRLILKLPVLAFLMLLAPVVAIAEDTVVNPGVIRVSFPV